MTVLLAIPWFRRFQNLGELTEPTLLSHNLTHSESHTLNWWYAYHNSLGLVKQIAPPPEFLVQKVWDEVQGLAFLTSSQITLLVPTTTLRTTGLRSFHYPDMVNIQSILTLIALLQLSLLPFEWILTPNTLAIWSRRCTKSTYLLFGW